MNEEQNPLEKNVERLIQASLPPEAHPGPRQRASLYGQLTRRLSIRKAAPQFPTTALVFLAVLFLFLTLLVSAKVAGLITLPLDSLALTLSGGMVLVNLLCLPLASIFIIQRSNHVKKSR